MCRVGGPRCPTHARQRLEAAFESRDMDRIRAARDDWFMTIPGNHELAAEDPATARRYMLDREQLFDRYTDPDEAMAYLINSDTYSGLVDARDAAVATHEELRGTNTSELDRDGKRAHALATREALMQKLDAQRALSDYQARTAVEAAKITLNVPEYDQDTLGEAVPHIRSEENVTIGGSELSSVLKLDPKYGASNRAEVMAYKVDPSQRNRTQTEAQRRGDVWEPVIVRDFSDRHPEYQVMTSTQTWSHPDHPEDQAKLDALLSSTGDGVPDSFLECKTASDGSKWVSEDGEPCVPAGYRAQVLSYLETTGFSHAYVAVRIDDREYQEFRIDRGEKITEKAGTIADNRAAMDKFRAEVRAARAGNPVKGRTVNPHPNPEPKHGVESQIALYQQRDEEQVRAGVQARVDAGVSYSDAVRAEMAAHPFNPDGMVVVDLETTGFTPGSGEVIEFAYQRLDANGGVATQGSVLCSPDDRFLRTKGTGMQDIHNISPDMVRSKPQFASARVQDQIKEHFPEGTIVVAHNAGFEQRFLDVDMRDSGSMKYLDTMTLSKFFATGTSDNQLGTFAEHHGVSYEGAHRALADVDMTRRALGVFASRTHQP